MPLTLPAILEPDQVDQAAALLARYVGDRRTTAIGHEGDPYWSGSCFESYGRNERDTITSDDLVAVSMLAVTVPAHAALCLTGHQAERVTELLRELPNDLDLADDDAEDKLGPAYELWNLIYDHHDIGTTLASKILARKRPRLIPVQDRVVRAALAWDRTADFWLELRTLLRADDAALVARLHRIRDIAGVGSTISDLRVLDIVTWMSAHSPAGGA